MSKSPLQISIVVPTYDRSAKLAECLAALAKQDVPPASFELVVVDDGSQDDTERVVRTLGAALKNGPRSALAVYYCYQGRHRGVAAARNRGIRESHAPIVAFTDDDCQAAPNWIGNLLAAWERAQWQQLVVGGIGGRVLPPVEDSQGVAASYTHFHRWLETPRIVEGQVHYLVGCNASFRRDVLDVVGGFDEAFPDAAGDDVDLGRRICEAGFSLWYAADAVVYRGSSSSVPGLLRSAFRYGRGATHHEAKRGELTRPERALGSSLLRLGQTPWRASDYRQRTGMTTGTSLGIALLDGLVSVAAASGRCVEMIIQQAREESTESSEPDPSQPQVP